MRMKNLPLALASATIVALSATATAQSGAVKSVAASTLSRRGGVSGPADLIVVNGRVYTVDDSRPMVSGFAVKNGRILFAGSDGEVRSLAGPRTRIVNAGGATVIPGMVDAHAHLAGLGNSLANANLAGSRTYAEAIARVVDHSHAAKPGEWIFGRGWDQNLWPDKQFPTHEALTKAFPNNPVVLTRIDGHALLANAMAMRAAKITAATPDPSGGRIIRLSGNAPSGVFVDNAESLVGRAEPSPSRDQLTKEILSAIAEANRWGLTGIDDPGEPHEIIDIYESLAKQGKYNLRNYVLVSGDSRHGDVSDVAYYTSMGPRSALYDGHIWVRSIKLYADGALGSRGAALLAPYSDDPGNTGLLVTPPAELERIAELALRTGFQVGVHAIGDRGNRIVLDAYEQALKAVPTADHRFRIEHAQVMKRDGGRNA